MPRSMCRRCYDIKYAGKPAMVLDVGFNVCFGVQSHHRGRGRQILATLPKIARSDCLDRPSTGFEPTLADAGFEINRLKPLDHHTSPT